MSRCLAIATAAILVLACITSVQAEVIIDTVTVGNPGNMPDDEIMWQDGTTGYGRVNHVFDIGTFEVTVAQYTEFLNAVAHDDTYGLYNAFMADATDGRFGSNIQRDGSPGYYTYSTIGPEWADRPVNFVSWGDAARFANWIHNGQPTGAQDLTTTEDGSYYLNGATNDTAMLSVVREEDATWVIPSEDEWYKAAYHYNDGVTDNYYDYPTSSDNVPSGALVDPDSGNNATIATVANIQGDQDHSYTIGSPFWRTEVGDHETSESPYGTFDQGGNVLEWNEGVRDSSRMFRGGSFLDSWHLLRPPFRYGRFPSFEHGTVGFRLANVPEPATAFLLVVATAVSKRRRAPGNQATRNHRQP